VGFADEADRSTLPSGREGRMTGSARHLTPCHDIEARYTATGSDPAHEFPGRSSWTGGAAAASPGTRRLVDSCIGDAGRSCCQAKISASRGCVLRRHTIMLGFG